MELIETIRDNQWWYARHPLREHLDGVERLVLIVGGRRCQMVHSARGADGRVTRSFRFVQREDRDHWAGLRGRSVSLRVEVPRSSEQVVGGEKSREPQRRVISVRPVRDPQKSIARTSDTEFDAFLFVDWSASSSPGRGPNSIWIAEGWFEGSGLLRVDEPSNPDTRARAEAWVNERLALHASQGRRVLVGFDFAFGYPNGDVPRLVGTADANWSGMWKVLSEGLKDGQRNENNRWEVAAELNERLQTFGFWGCPDGHETTWLLPTKAANRQVMEFRLVEQSLRRGGSKPFSVWQLYGNGSVGSQAITGIPVCARIRKANGLQVWPFETQTRLPSRRDASHILVEVWPGAIDVDLAAHTVKDAAQVLALVRWAASEDVAGTLARWFQLKGLSDEHRRLVIAREGWILGHLPV